MDYRIVQVLSRRDLRRFVKFPLDLYKDCPQYVPALNSDQYKSLTDVPMLSYCERVMWLALDQKDRVVGRICAMLNPRYNELYGKKRVRFGWFDTIDDFAVASLLIHTAEKWALEKGMDEVHGPLFYNTLGKQGMLVEGFENIPPFNCLYNYPYYNDFMTRLGYEKECDWVQYKVKADMDVPEKMHAIADRVQERYHFVEGDIERLKKDKSMIREFFRIYNESFSTSVLNFIPFTQEEIDMEAAQSIPMLNKDLCTFLLSQEGEIAAFGISFPSISKALQKAKGRLFPFGWYHLLKALRSYDTIDLMINGAAPDWQRSGVSAVYHCMMSEKTKKTTAKWAITNPQIETNSAAKVWERYDPQPFMRRRCYVKRIAE